MTTIIDIPWNEAIKDSRENINANFTNLNNDKQEILAEWTFVDWDKTKLDWIESGAEVNDTAAEIKTKYESNADTNAFTDNEKTDLSQNTSNRNRIKVSSNDNTSNFLRAKLTAGTNITITEVNDWWNEFVQIDSTVPTGDWDVTYINTTKIDSTDGTNSNYWVLNWLVNGVNTVFTVSNWEYVSWTLKVSRNGKWLVQWDSEDWTETNPATWTFTFNTAPETGDELTVSYITQETNTWNLLFEKDIQNITGNYTILSTDRNIFVDATAWDVTLTLPAVADMDSLGLRVVKSDNTGNNVIITPPWAELISGASSYTMSIPYEDIWIVTNGANYFLISN